MTFYALVALIAAVISFGASWAVWGLSHRFKLYPGIRERDVHTTPTPRLGGIAIVIGIETNTGSAAVRTRRSTGNKPHRTTTTTPARNIHADNPARGGRGAPVVSVVSF